MIEGQKPDDPIEGSAYSDEFTLHRDLLAACGALDNSEAMRSILGDEFVTKYCKVKDAEFKEFQEIIADYVRRNYGVTGEP